MSMPWIDDVPSIVQSWYLGSVGSEALTDILCGDINPSGKLPFSYPVKLEDCPAHYYGTMSYPGDNVKQEYKEDILVGYRWYDTKRIKSLFPFGYGMSYTEFEYSKAKASSSTITDDAPITISLKVKNTGKYEGKETVQLYIGDEKSSELRPLKELKGFSKVSLKSGEEKEVKFTITVDDLKFFSDKSHSWVVESGKFKAYIASSSRDISSEVDFVY